MMNNLLMSLIKMVNYSKRMISLFEKKNIVVIVYLIITYLSISSNSIQIITLCTCSTLHISSKMPLILGKILCLLSPKTLNY